MQSNKKLGVTCSLRVAHKTKAPRVTGVNPTMSSEVQETRYSPSVVYLCNQTQDSGKPASQGYRRLPFGRIHKSLRIAPAMVAGVSDHVRSLEEIAELAK